MRNIALLAVLLFTSTPLTQAQVSNGTFATGDLNDWQTLGSPTVVPSGAGNPTTPNGGNQAVISSTVEDLTLVNSVSVSTIDAALNTTLPSTNGIPPGDTLPGTFDPVNGQAIYQNFTMAGSGTIKFDFAFTTGDYSPYDSAGFVLDGVYTELTKPGPYNGTNPPFQSQPYQAFTIDLGAGAHTLGFVSYNTHDHDGASNLYLNNVQTTITGPLVDAPEPATWAMFAMGLGALFLFRRLKKSA